MEPHGFTCALGMEAAGSASTGTSANAPNSRAQRPRPALSPIAPGMPRSRKTDASEFRDGRVRALGTVGGEANELKNACTCRPMNELSRQHDIVAQCWHFICGCLTSRQP